MSAEGAARAGKLSRERILEVALDVAEGEGIEALSMRRLAQELDVWPMSVYRYFRDKEELLDAVVDGAAEEIALTAGSGSWREQIRDLLHDARAALGQDPAGLRTRFTRAMLTPGALRLSEAGLRILQDAGFEPDEAARRARAALATLPADEYPALTAAADGFAGALAGDEELDYGLDRLLDGLEARLGTRA